MSAREELASANPDALVADGLDAAMVGYTINTGSPNVAVYDARKCVEILVERDGMTHDEAEEYLEHNTFCAYVGPNGPLYIRTILEDRDAAQERVLAKDSQPEHQDGNGQGEAAQAGCCHRPGRCGKGEKEGQAMNLAKWLYIRRIVETAERETDAR